MDAVKVDPARFERLVNPRTIAIFGGAQAQEAIRQCDLLGYDGEIWPVHPKADEVQGRRVYRSVDELPGSPDASYVGVNRNLTIDIVRGLAERDAGGAISYATGFAEAGEDGFEATKQLLEASGDMVLVGPNCYGLLNYVTGAALWPDQQGGRRVDSGVAIITMSSNVGFNITMQRRGLPIAYMVSLGNRLKFDLNDAIKLFAGRKEVTAIGLYLEAMPDPKGFQEAVEVARALGKPMVAVKTGRSQVAQRVVLSHTASLAGSDALISSLFDRVGVARVDSLEALVEALKLLHVVGPLQGGRIGAMSTSGGDLTLLADALTPDLTLPPLSPKVAEGLDAVVHERVVASNPFDYQMFSWDDDDANAEIFGAFMAEDFDIALCALDYPRADKCDPSTWGGAERGFVRATKATGTKGAVLATFADTVSEPVAERLMQDGVAMLAGIDDAVAAVQAAVDVGAAWKRPPSQPLLVAPFQVDHDALTVLDEAASKAMLAEAGVPVPESRVVGNVEEAVAAAEDARLPGRHQGAGRRPQDRRGRRAPQPAERRGSDVGHGHDGRPLEIVPCRAHGRRGRRRGHRGRRPGRAVRAVPRGRRRGHPGRAHEGQRVPPAPGHERAGPGGAGRPPVRAAPQLLQGLPAGGPERRRRRGPRDRRAGREGPGGDRGAGRQPAHGARRGPGRGRGRRPHQAQRGSLDTQRHAGPGRRPGPAAERTGTDEQR